MNKKSVLGYYQLGFRLIFTKGLKRFVLFPLLINLIIFSSALFFLYSSIKGIESSLIIDLPSWLHWLTELIVPLIMIIAVTSMSYTFIVVNNWIAAPFNGLLAERITQHLQNQPIDSNTRLSLAIIKSLPGSFSREWLKLKYYLPKALGYFLLSLVLPLVGPLIWFIFTAWMIAIQYCDYIFDHHHIDFNCMKDSLKEEKLLTLKFGTITSLLFMIPVLNWFLAPVAIIAATAMSLDHFEQQLNWKKDFCS